VAGQGGRPLVGADVELAAVDLQHGAQPAPEEIDHVAPAVSRPHRNVEFERRDARMAREPVRGVSLGGRARAVECLAQGPPKVRTAVAREVFEFVDQGVETAVVTDQGGPHQRAHLGQPVAVQRRVRQRPGGRHDRGERMVACFGGRLGAAVRPAGAANPYTGNAVAGGSRTTVNTNTGRVTESAGVAGRTNEGAGAAGAFNSEGARGDVSGAGYVHYDKGSGEVSKGGVINYNDQIYAGKDGNVYKYEKGEGWSEVGGAEPKFNRASDLPSAGNLDNDRYARDRGGERDFNRNPGMQAGGRDFDRGSYGGNYRGQMGGYRSARGGGGFGGGGGRRR